jgi:hypothetical protein
LKQLKRIGMRGNAAVIQRTACLHCHAALLAVSPQSG